jgi:hypothetical protein
MYHKLDNKRLTPYERAIVKQRIRCSIDGFSKYVSDVVVFRLRMARKGRNMLWTERIKVTPVNSQLRSQVYLKGIRICCNLRVLCSGIQRRAVRRTTNPIYFDTPRVSQKTTRYQASSYLFLQDVRWLSTAVISEMIELFINMAVRTSNPAQTESNIYEYRTDPSPQPHTVSDEGRSQVRNNHAAYWEVPSPGCSYADRNLLHSLQENANRAPQVTPTPLPSS